MLDVKELTRAGKDMGLEGEALKSFVSEQQERNDREREREIAIAREERELEKQNYELQLRASELKFQEDEKRLETLAKEMELFQLKKDSQDVAEQSFTSTSGTTHRHKLPPLPCFDETKEEIDHFLNRFEKYFNAADYNPEAKAIVLCSYLKGTALAVFNRLPTEDSNNYEKLKAALLLRYDVTAEKCREDFRRIRIADNESYREFKARLADKLTKWLSQDNKKATYDDLFDLIIKDQLMATFPSDLRIQVKEKGIKTADEVAEHAQRFRDARKNARPQITQQKKQDIQVKTDTKASKDTKVSKESSSFKTKQPPSQLFCRACKANHDYKTCKVSLEMKKKRDEKKSQQLQGNKSLEGSK